MTGTHVVEECPELKEWRPRGPVEARWVPRKGGFDGGVLRGRSPSDLNFGGGGGGWRMYLSFFLFFWASFQAFRARPMASP